MMVVYSIMHASRESNLVRDLTFSFGLNILYIVPGAFLNKGIITCLSLSNKFVKILQFITMLPCISCTSSLLCIALQLKRDAMHFDISLVVNTIKTKYLINMEGIRVKIFILSMSPCGKEVVPATRTFVLLTHLNL